MLPFLRGTVFLICANPFLLLNNSFASLKFLLISPYRWCSPKEGRKTRRKRKGQARQKGWVFSWWRRRRWWYPRGCCSTQTCRQKGKIGKLQAKTSIGKIFSVLNQMFILLWFMKFDETVNCCFRFNESQQVKPTVLELRQLYRLIVFRKFLLFFIQRKIWEDILNKW